MTSKPAAYYSDGLRKFSYSIDDAIINLVC